MEKWQGTKSMEEVRFYDTNALIDAVDSAALEGEFAISSITLSELENMKTNSKDLHKKYKARKTIKYLNENGSFQVVVYNLETEKILSSYYLSTTPDNQICACCRWLMDNTDKKIIFVTNDLSCKVIASGVLGIETETFYKKEEIYKGYKLIRGTTEYINSTLLPENFTVNEYAVLQNTDDNSEKELRFDGKEFVRLKLPQDKYIKGKNALQRCALDLLNNQNIPIVAILGGYGSGKTWLSMRMAVYQAAKCGEFSRILGVREPRGEGQEVGFLPGDFQSKTDNFFLPLAQQLDGGEYELDRLKEKIVLELNIPFYMKGTTYDNTVILVDEAEDLTQKQIKLIGTRLGQNSRIYFSGDYKQSLINSSKDNALVAMCNELKGNPNFGCIYLEEDVRSEASKLFANLYEN